MKLEHMKEVNNIVTFINGLYDSNADYRLIYQFPVDFSIPFDDDFIQNDLKEWNEYIRSHIKNRLFLGQTWLSKQHQFCFFIEDRNVVDKTSFINSHGKKVKIIPIDEEENKTSSFDYSPLVEKVKNFIDGNKLIKGNSYEPFCITIDFPYGRVYEGFNDVDFTNALIEAGFNVDRAFAFKDGSGIKVEFHATADTFIRQLSDIIDEMYNRDECSGENTTYNFYYPAYLDNDLRDLNKAVFSCPDYIKDIVVNRENHQVEIKFNNPIQIKKDKFKASQIALINKILDEDGETHIEISVDFNYMDDILDVLKRYLYRIHKMSYEQVSGTIGNLILDFFPEGEY